jgi:hypothetical protein
MEGFEHSGDPVSVRQEDLAPIEDLAARLGIAPSMLAAVMQSRDWAGGKQVSEREFKEAVTAFLDAPMSGIRR